MKKVVVLALDNAFLTTITIPVDVFQSVGVTWNMAHGLALSPYFDVKMVTSTGKAVNTLNGISINPQMAMDDVGKADLVIVPAVLHIDKTIKEQPEIFPWLLDQYEQGAHLASICMGSFILAEMGLLDGKDATTHWAQADHFRQRYPKVNLKAERLFTDAGDIFCSGAASSSIDLGLYLIEKYCGREIAIQTAKLYIHDMNRIYQSPYSTFHFQRNHNDQQIHQSQRFLEESFAESLDFSQIAEQQGMARRTFERRFKAATGDTPLLYLQRVRVEKAKQILENDLSNIDEISWTVGYDDSSHFNKIFVRHTGLKPTEYRSKFQRVIEYQP